MTVWNPLGQKKKMWLHSYLNTTAQCPNPPRTQETQNMIKGYYGQAVIIFSGDISDSFLVFHENWATSLATDHNPHGWQYIVLCPPKVASQCPGLGRDRMASLIILLDISVCVLGRAAACMCTTARHIWTFRCLVWRAALKAIRNDGLIYVQYEWARVKGHQIRRLEMIVECYWSSANK